jgi:hypothetical protein
VQEHDVPWVIRHFRPLLDKINIDNIPEEPDYQVELLSDTRQYIQLGMEDCILTICRRNFQSKANGFYTFSHKEYEGQRLFFLNIYINNNLFVSENPVLRVERRSAVIHEFTHCIAAFLSIGKIISEISIDGLVKKLISRVKINAQVHYQSLLIQFGNTSSAVTNVLGIYPDEHFRLGYEDFEHSFSVVYKQLILDRNIFEKYFTDDLRNKFNRAIRHGNTANASVFLGEALSNLISAEAISADFINLRLREEFLGYYYLKAA